MATIRKRGDRWQVQIRRQGCTPVSRSFLQKADAQVWARQMEAEADRHGLPADPKVLKRLTVQTLIERYRDDVVSLKRSREIETIILNAFLRHRFTKRTLAEFTPEAIGDYRDQRLKTVKAVTVCRELGLLQHAFEVARREWGIPLPSNPVAHVRKPRKEPGRNRRLKEGEWAALMAAADGARNKHLKPLIEFAVETGMRLGEIVAIRWADWDGRRDTLHIPLAKNGEARTIPLSSTAVAILRAAMASAHGPFPVTTRAVKLGWRRIVKRAGIADLHFHDLRHEAISRLFERGLSAPEVALISGHKDFRMVARYTHMMVANIGRKLNAPMDLGQNAGG